MMLKEELIKQIQEKVPDGAEIVVFDWRKNLNDDSGDGSSAGIYKDFNLVVNTKEEIENGCIPFASIEFENDDYDEEGRRVGGLKHPYGE